MTKDTMDSIAATEFIRFIESGEYRDMKHKENFLKLAKTHMREMLEPKTGKRHEYDDLNMVAKFVPKKVWETDHAGLIENLFCYVRPEVVFPFLRLDGKQMKEEEVSDTVKEYLLPKTFYIRPTLNKVGKNEVGKVDFLFGGQSEKELITEIREVTVRHKELQQRYERFKFKAKRCPVLKEKKKVSTPYGSVSLLPHKDNWDMAQIYEKCGEDFVIRYGRAITAELDEMILKGIIPNSLVTEHRKLVDIQLDFIVMQLDVESRIMSIQNQKRQSASLRRLA